MKTEERPLKDLVEYAEWCVQTNPTMYGKMCWWYDRAQKLESETAGLRALVGELRELANRREPVTTDYYCWCETCCKVRAEEARKP